MVFKDDRFLPIDEREPVEESDDFDLEEQLEDTDLTIAGPVDKKREKFSLYVAS